MTWIVQIIRGLLLLIICCQRQCLRKDYPVGGDLCGCGQCNAAHPGNTPLLASLRDLFRPLGLASINENDTIVIMCLYRVALHYGTRSTSVDQCYVQNMGFRGLNQRQKEFPDSKV